MGFFRFGFKVLVIILFTQFSQASIYEFDVQGKHFVFDENALEHIVVGQVTTRIKDKPPLLWGGMHSIDGFKNFLSLRRDLKSGFVSNKKKSHHKGLYYVAEASRAGPVYLKLPLRTLSPTSNGKLHIEDREFGRLAGKTLFPIEFQFEDLPQGIESVIKHPEEISDSASGTAYKGSFSWRLEDGSESLLRIKVIVDQTGRIKSAYPTESQPLEHRLFKINVTPERFSTSRLLRSFECIRDFTQLQDNQSQSNAFAR